MRKITLFVQFIFLFVNSPRFDNEGIDVYSQNLSFACTSFAVYGEQPVYGMNFDYSDVEIRFSIQNTGDRKIFQLDAKLESQFVTICGMNSDGFFANLQMLFPECTLMSSTEENELFTWQIFGESLYQFKTVEEVEMHIENKKIIHSGMTLHSLFADKTGKAFVLEPGKERNQITKVENRFIVMTNFPICEFRNVSFDRVKGSGAGRYKTAYQHIQDHIEEFDINLAMRTLEMTILETENFYTQCSMGFDPANGEVLLTLDRKFDKIWKVSIDHESIETYSGFDKSKIIKLDAAGVFQSDLK